MARPNTLTHDLKVKFLAAVAGGMSLDLAAKSVGVTKRAVMFAMQRDKDFAAAARNLEPIEIEQIKRWLYAIASGRALVPMLYEGKIVAYRQVVSVAAIKLALQAAEPSTWHPMIQYDQWERDQAEAERQANLAKKEEMTKDEEHPEEAIALADALRSRQERMNRAAILASMEADNFTDDRDEGGDDDR